MQANLDRAIDLALDEKRIVGTVVVAAKDGDIVYARAAGFADREAGIEVSRDSIFRLASLTKAVVAAIILKMQDEGLLSVEDPVTKFLPYFTPQTHDGQRPTILLRHLLLHCAGLPIDVTPTAEELASPLLQGVNGSYRHLTLTDHLKRLAARPLDILPGTAWAYGLSFDVLGAVVAEIYGGTLQEAVAHYVTAPLGMVDTLFGVRDVARLTKPYADAKPEPALMAPTHPLLHRRGHTTVFTPDRILDADVFPAGGAGLSGTADDFMAFLQAVQWGDFLAPDTLQAGVTPQKHSFVLDGGETQVYLGVSQQSESTRDAPLRAGSYSWGGVFGNSWFVDPQSGIALVALTNTAFEGLSGQFVTDLQRAVYA